MTTELDLDINNYNISDIEKFFRFKPKSEYTENDVELREYELREQFLSSGHINKKLKRDLISFLTLAKQWLIDIKCVKKDPTSIPKNFRLDEDNYPRSSIPPQREQNLIAPPITPFLYTKNSDFYQGTLNPIEKRVVTKLLCIDTLFRPNYNESKSTDFIYTLPDSINNVVSIQLTATELPSMWYSVSSADHSNQMIIEMNNICKTDENLNKLDENGNIIDPAAPCVYENYKFTINIPDGNYLDTTFDSVINNTLANLVTDDNGKNTSALKFIIIFVDTISGCTIIRANNTIQDSMPPSPPPPCPYDSTNNYYSPDFTFTVNFDVSPELTIPLYKKIGWMMGFRKPQYTINENNVYVSYSDNPKNAIYYEGYLKSESTYGSTIFNYIFIDVDDYHNNFPTDTIVSMNNSTSNYLGKNILARITLTNGANTTVTDNAADQILKKREYFGPIKLEKMRIRLLNRFGDVVNMNKNDFSMALEIKQLYSN